MRLPEPDEVTVTSAIGLEHGISMQSAECRVKNVGCFSKGPAGVTGEGNVVNIKGAWRDKDGNLTGENRENREGKGKIVAEQVHWIIG